VALPSSRLPANNIQENTMRLAICELICIGALGTFAFGSNAATDSEKMSKERYEATVSQADADYKAAIANCKGMQGNDKDVCEQQAKANREKVKADAKASRKSTDAVADARDDKLEADYKVAKEKCDALSGSAKDACVSNAKLRYHQ
jgi:hypothetical protein